MNTPVTPNPVKSDVLHSENHKRLSSEEIAKAVARHNREHRKDSNRGPTSQKTTPRR